MAYYDDLAIAHVIRIARCGAGRLAREVGIVQFLEQPLVLAERIGAKSAVRTYGMSIFGRMHGMLFAFIR